MKRNITMDRNLKLSTIIQKQHGFSLIEIMIALVIALILMVAIGQVFLGNKQAYKTQEDLSRMQEDARFAIEAMSRSIRMAGYKGNGSAAVFPANSVLAGTDAASANGSDTLIVRYAGSSLLSNVLTPDGSVIDCLGNGVPRDTISSNKFYIANDPANNNEPSLFCDTSTDNFATTTTKVLVPGVESMQILWGMDADGDGAPNCYLAVSTNNCSGQPFNTDNVVVLRISLLMRTYNQVGVAVDGKTYQHFGVDYPNYGTDLGAQFVAPADLRIRRFFSTTIGVRNRLS